MISVDDMLWFIDDVLDGMAAIVGELGDELANQRPDVPGANSPYVVLHHCLGVVEFWGGHVIAGRTVTRDRDAEFRASGPVDELLARTRRAREQLAADVAEIRPADPPRLHVWDPEDAALPLGRTQGGALTHVYGELAQHLGQMEGCRDVLRAPWAQVR